MHEFLIKILALSAGLMANAYACDFNEWSSTGGTPITGQPTDTPPVIRYSSECGIQMDQVGDYLADANPSSEREYFARFYYYTGAVGGDVDIFQARSHNGPSALPIRVQHDGSQLTFSTNGGGASLTAAVANNRWYSIELDWKAGVGSGPANGTLSVTVTGNGNQTPVLSSTITAIANTGDTVEDVRLGLITGSFLGKNAKVHFDAFESRRNTSPGRLCVGDALRDGSINAFDIAAIIGEINATSLANGQPDLNDDGAVNVLDLGALVPLINGNATCS